MTMSTASRKAKGARLQKALVADILERFPELTSDDIVSRPMGSQGDDLMLSTAARGALFNLAFECKNQESLNIWGALEQSEARSKPTEISAVVFKRNRSETYIALNVDDFLFILRRASICKEPIENVS